MAECLIYMLSNTQQLDLCQYMKEYENDSFFSQNCPNFFFGPRIWGRDGHTQPKFIFYLYFVTINNYAKYEVSSISRSILT